MRKPTAKKPGRIRRWLRRHWPMSRKRHEIICATRVLKAIKSMRLERDMAFQAMRLAQEEAKRGQEEKP